MSRLGPVNVLKEMKSSDLSIRWKLDSINIYTMTETIEKNAHMFITKPFDLLQVKMLARSIIEEPEL